MEHEKIVRETLLAVGRLPFFRCWRNETGVALTFSEPHRPFAYGVKGSGDILGILAPSGRFVSLEIKSGNATQRESQKNFEAMTIRMGGLYFLVRNANEALSFITHAHARDTELCKR